MASRRILLLGSGDLADETGAALHAEGASVDRREGADAGEVARALAAAPDAVAIVSRDDAWPLRAALLVRHLDADVPIVATITDVATGQELEEVIGNCRFTSLADVAAPSLAGPCIGEDIAALVHDDATGTVTGLRVADGHVERVELPEVQVRRLRAFASALLRPFDRSASLVFFGTIGLAAVLVFETFAAAIVLDQPLVDAFYGGVKTLVTVDPNAEVQDGPGWFKVVISCSMLIALLFAAAFTGGLVERLIGHNLTGLFGRRAVPRSDHVVVVGLGHVGLRLALLLRQCGYLVVAVDGEGEGQNVGRARQLGLPVVVGQGNDPTLLKRLFLDHALAVAAVSADDLENVAVALAVHAHAPDLRLVLRAGSGAAGDETQSLRRLGAVRDVHRIAAVHLAGLALGSEARHVVADGEVGVRCDGERTIERAAYPIAS